MKLTILVGPPGSGKSTYAKQLESERYIRISQDDQGKAGHMDLFQSHVTTGANIVVDRMNFDRSQRDKYRLEAVKNGYTVNFVEFCVPRKVCLQRCMTRTGHPTITEEKHAESALTTYFSRYEPVSEEEGLLQIISFSVPKKPAVMVDLDNTLCDTSHREHFVREKKDWVNFFKECGKDGLYKEIHRQIKLEQAAGTDIILCSGRPEDQTRYLTEMWLESHKVSYTNLVMRPKLNYKKDDITKAMLYMYEIAPFYDILYVLDDRDCVVKKWRELGLNCWQVRNGNF